MAKSQCERKKAFHNFSAEPFSGVDPIPETWIIFKRTRGSLFPDSWIFWAVVYTSPTIGFSQATNSREQAIICRQKMILIMDFMVRSFFEKIMFDKEI